MTNKKKQIKTPPKILITGASGYIGGRLLIQLEKKGFSCRCLTRKKEFFKNKFPINNNTPNREIIEGDATDYDSLVRALKGIDTAYYLIHSMGSKESFVKKDRLCAENFIKAAETCTVKKIIYLGGLSNKDDKHLSPHLKSRLEVGTILRTSKIPLITFRASIILGPGSASFELIRNLTEKLPIMLVPKWVKIKAQPISISDVLSYLMKALKIDTKDDKIYEIGGKTNVSYLDIMKEYAKQRHLKRLFISIPFITPKVSSFWLGVITPVYARVGRKLIDGIRNQSVVKHPENTKKEFAIEPISYKDAIKKALDTEDHHYFDTHWADAVSSAGLHPHWWQGLSFGNRIVTITTITIHNKSCKDVFDPIQKIGGTSGWYFCNWVWQLRGLIDLIAGGAGLRRGRRHPTKLKVGDALDWWRVEKISPNKQLLLFSEMKTPGRAWLEFEVFEISKNKVRLSQTAIFDPLGMSGRLYWYLLFPIHIFIFKGLLYSLKKEIKKETIEV